MKMCYVKLKLKRYMKIKSSQHMGEISQGVQSLEMMSYFCFFLTTGFCNLEV